MSLSATPIRTPSFSVRSLIYRSGSPMEGIERFADRVARTESTALLTGETGTGKEVLARLIHARSSRASGPFVPLNCGAIPESLVESELFGCVKGAFTGAVASRKGRVAHAEGGTLFLDEIGELPLSLQVKLLRLLQERTYEPVGSSESVSANFRLIAATHRNLAAEVEAGRFRRDLYYRLLVCPIEVPALRQRPDDIRVLFEHFWASRGESRAVDGAVFTALRAHPWPGNIRELENLVERVSVCVDSPAIGVANLPLGYGGPEKPAPDAECENVVHLPPPAPIFHPTEGEAEVEPQPEPMREQPRGLGPASSVNLAEPVDLPALLRRLEDAYIDAALASAGGNRKAAADMLGLQRTTLVEKLRRRSREASIP